MEFRKSSVSPAQILIPGSCQAKRIHASLSRVMERDATSDWREEQELKQLAYERKRPLWRKLRNTTVKY